MNNIYLKWCLAQIKRNAKNIVFWLLIFIFVLAYLLCGYVEKGHSEAVDVLLCVEDSEYGEIIAGKLLENDTEGFNYTLMDSRDDVYLAVVRGEAPCGFVFTEDFDEDIRNNDPDESVILYQASDSIEGYTIKEVVYPMILKEAGNYILADYLDEKGTDSEAKEYVLNSYDEVKKSQEIKIFDAVYLDTDKTEEKEAATDITKYILLAILLVMTLSACIDTAISSKAFLKAYSKGVRMAMIVESALVNCIMYIVVGGAIIKIIEIL